MKSISLQSYIYEMKIPAGENKVIKELLLYAGIVKVIDLISSSKEKLMSIPGFKEEYVICIENYLQALSLHLDMDKEEQRLWTQNSFIKRFI